MTTDLAQFEELCLAQQPPLGGSSLEVAPRRRGGLRGDGARAREGEGEAAVRRHRGRGTLIFLASSLKYFRCSLKYIW